MASRYADLERKLFSAEEREASTRLARLEAEVLDLRELREFLGLSQAELARRVGQDQPELSRLERGKDIHLSTLTSLIAALGGELELSARFGNRSLRLTNGWLEGAPHDDADDAKIPNASSPRQSHKKKSGSRPSPSQKPRKRAA